MRVSEFVFHILFLPWPERVYRGDLRKLPSFQGVGAVDHGMRR